VDPNAIASVLQDWGYPAMLALLCATGVGSPIPEDLLLVSGGYLISAGVFSWQIALPLSIVGVVASDFLLYTFGRHMRAHSLTGWRARIIPMRRFRSSAPWFARAGPQAVLLARLVPGTRVIVFITAGFQGVRPLVFLAYDVAGALIWVPLLLWFGVVLGEEIGGLGALLSGISRAAFWIILAAVLLLLVWHFWKVEESKL
jgi:membrane protein DedA with SNARE-associated domain